MQVENADDPVIEDQRNGELRTRVAPALDIVGCLCHVGRAHNPPRAGGERNEARRVERNHVDRRARPAAPADPNEDGRLLFHQEEAAGLVGEVLRERVEDLVEENPPVGGAYEERVGRIREAPGLAHRRRHGIGRAPLRERDTHEIRERLKSLDVVIFDLAGRVAARDGHDADRLPRRPHRKGAERTRPELPKTLLRRAFRLLLDVVHDERLSRLEDAKRDGRTFRRSVLFDLAAAVQRSTTVNDVVGMVAGTVSTPSAAHDA